MGHEVATADISVWKGGPKTRGQPHRTETAERARVRGRRDVALLTLGANGRGIVPGPKHGPNSTRDKRRKQKRTSHKT